MLFSIDNNYSLNHAKRSGQKDLFYQIFVSTFLKIGNEIKHI